MKAKRFIPSDKLLAVLAALALTQPGVFAADPAASDATTKKADDDTIVLSPFTVDASKDRGYLATNATSGTRLNTPIKDLPMPISVITEKFLRDTGSTDLRQGLRYVSGIQLQSQNDQGTPGGAYQGPGGVNNPEGATANPTQTSYKIRGYVTDAVLRDGFRRQNATDSINIERVEVVFGPSALLYGFGEYGGIVNYHPKAPQSKAAAELGVTYGSYDFMRGTVDVTGPISKTMAFNYRVTGAYEDTHSWTDFNTQRHAFVSPAISFRPTPTTLVDVDYESGKMWQDGIGFTRVRAMANVGVNSDQNEHADFYTVPGTDGRRFRWSGPDTFQDTQATNFRAQVTQTIIPDMTLLVGYNRSTADFQRRDVIGNLNQNVGPAALRARVFFTTLNPTIGDSNLNAVNGYVDNVVLQYGWSVADTKTALDQFRGELNYKFALFNTSSKWLRLQNSFLLGHSEDSNRNDVVTGGTKANTYNYKSPIDKTYIRYGKQGDGTPDAAFNAKQYGNFSKGWDQATYGVYQGQLLDGRLTLIGGIRNDRTDNFTRTANFVDGTSNTARSDKVSADTRQYGASVQLTRHISLYALKAGGLQPNFSGHLDVNGKPVGPVTAKSREYGLKFDVLDGKISGSVSTYKIKRSGTELFFWWAPTSNYHNFNASKDIVYNVNNFSPSSAPGGSNGGNGAADSALTQWNAGVAAGAIYQKAVGGTTNLYVNASKPQGAAYLDSVFDYTKSHGMSWPGWLYINDTETNNSWDDRASSPQGNEYVIGSDSAKGWNTEITFSPTANFQIVANYSHTERVIDKAGQFAKSPNPKDRWAVWYFPNTDWGLTGKPLSTVYTDAQDTSTWTGIGYGSGERQDDTPEHAVSVWANYQFARDSKLKGLSTALGASWESPREYQSGITHGGGQRITDKNGNIVILKTPERYNVDLMIRYAFKLHDHDASVQLNVFNLLNDTKLYGLIYSAPRSARMEFSYRF
jgi:outer membrane receptor protein involved in Fe transport